MVNVWLHGSTVRKKCMFLLIRPTCAQQVTDVQVESRWHTTSSGKSGNTTLRQAENIGNNN